MLSMLQVEAKEQTERSPPPPPPGALKPPECLSHRAALDIHQPSLGTRRTEMIPRVLSVAEHESQLWNTVVIFFSFLYL